MTIFLMMLEYQYVLSSLNMKTFRVIIIRKQNQQFSGRSLSEWKLINFMM